MQTDSIWDFVVWRTAAGDAAPDVIEAEDVVLDADGALRFFMNKELVAAYATGAWDHFLKSGAP